VNNPLDAKENDEHAFTFALNLSRHLRSRWVWTIRVRIILSSPKAYIIIVRVSVAFFSEICTKFYAVPFSDRSQNRIRPDARLRKKDAKIRTSTQLRQSLNIDSQGMLVLSSTVASRYYNCCTDGSTSPGNYGYSIMPHHDVGTTLNPLVFWFVLPWRSVSSLRDKRIQQSKTFWSHSTKSDHSQLRCKCYVHYYSQT
jgi:hypothetical protein